MKSEKLLLSITAALLAGVLQTWFLLWCWAFIASYSPLTGWLLGTGLRGTAFYTTVGLVDLATTVVLCLPVAYVLFQLRPKRIWLYLALAVIPSFIWLNRALPGASFHPPIGQMVLASLSEWAALPVAVWLVRATGGASNKSFKPNPLRGSA
jgi:hypothetical protein